MLHELLTWLSAEGLSRDGLYIFAIIIIIGILKHGTEGIIDIFWFFRKGNKREKTNWTNRDSNDA